MPPRRQTYTIRRNKPNASMAAKLLHEEARDAEAVQRRLREDFYARRGQAVPR